MAVGQKVDRSLGTPPIVWLFLRSHANNRQFIMSRRSHQQHRLHHHHHHLPKLVCKKKYKSQQASKIGGRTQQIKEPLKPSPPDCPNTRRGNNREIRSNRLIPPKTVKLPPRTLCIVAIYCIPSQWCAHFVWLTTVRENRVLHIAWQKRSRDIFDRF